MKKTVASMCLMFMTSSVMAADGTINFTGSITDQTCTVGNSVSVNLEKVAKSALDGGSGKKAAPTPFTISLTDCPDTVTGASVTFDGTPDSVNQTLLALDSGTGNATGVGIEIADKNGTPIPVHTRSPDFTLSSGSNSLEFLARYVSTGATVGTGKANGTSQFTIAYK